MSVPVVRALLRFGWLASAFSWLASATGCSFHAPETNRPLGCACDPVPNQFVYCDYATCRAGDCMPGFFDVDRDPTNGCETDFAGLPGNLNAQLERYYYVYIAPPGTPAGGSTAGRPGANPNYLTYTLDGFLSLSAPTLPCYATAANPCSYRLEALQIPLEDTSAPTWTGLYTNLDQGLIAASRPIEGIDTGTGEGVVFPGTSLSVSFSNKGARTSLVTSEGSLAIVVNPRSDGTVTLHVEGSVTGRLYGVAVSLSFTDRGITPVTFPPDARPPVDAGLDRRADATTNAEVDARVEANADATDASNATDPSDATDAGNATDPSDATDAGNAGTAADAADSASSP